MLERATACLEPRFSLFSRRINHPARSNRTLHPSFWRNAADTRSTPSWWPAYLQDVCDISLAQSRARSTPANLLEPVNDDTNVPRHMRLLNARQSKTVEIPRGGLYSQRLQKKGKRAFSLSHRKRDGAVQDPLIGQKAESMQPGNTRMYEDDVSGADADHAYHGSPADEMLYSGGPVNISFLQASQKPDAQLSPSQSLRALLDSDDTNAYGKAWQLFIRIVDQGKFAGDMLRYLSNSDQRIDLDHAIRVYRLIPSVDRSLSHYQAVIKALCRRKQHKIAIQIHHDAVDRGFHVEITNMLLGFLVRNKLWKTAAQVWDRLPSSQKNAADPRNQRLWEEIGQDTALPEKLLHLMNRLEQKAAVFVSEEDHIFGLGVQLLYRDYGEHHCTRNAGITGPVSRFGPSQTSALLLRNSDP